jgi:hypothetical protein
MGCGCSKRSKGAAKALPQTELRTAPAPTAKRVAVYEVKDSGGDVVLSTTSASAARSEAKRLGASVRVTSQRVDTAAPALAG